MAPFYYRFPQLLSTETGWLVRATRGGLPAGRYFFLEYYCDDLSCDCRYVLLQVWEKRWIVSAPVCINYGWEPEEFYAGWAPRETCAAALESRLPQPDLALALLRFFQSRMMPDRTYLARLKRRYRMFRRSLYRRN